MSKLPTFRFMVDTGEKRSSVWTVTINRNDIYIFSSITKQTKISLHNETGTYQWSIISEALQCAPFVPETGRHMARWDNPQVPAGDFTQNFFVLIAESELKAEHKAAEKKVTCLPPPSVGYAAQVNFLVSNQKIGQVLNVEPQPLFLHHLQDNRMLVLVHREIKIPAMLEQSLKATHSASLKKAQDSGVKDMYALARITSPTGVSGMMEVTPRVPLAIFASPQEMDSPMHWVANGARDKPLK